MPFPNNIDHDLLFLLNGSDSLFVDNLALLLTSGITWIPIYVSLLYVIIKNNDTMKQIMLVLACVILCIILSDGVADFIVKPLVARERPSYDHAIKYSVKIVNDMRGSGYSFFSAHASNTMSIAMFVSLLMRDRRLVITMFVWSLINCWTRLYLGVHYPTDILAGMLWGLFTGVCAYIVYFRAYLKMYPGFNYISSQYTKTGYNRNDIDLVLVVFIMSLLYCIIRALII
ncbi:MAG: phosphatase PAP2 family protein [Prevotella sp.]